MLKSILREPLVHFLVLGGLLFATWNWLAPQESAGPQAEVITLDQARLDHLQTLWTAQWKRDPAPADLKAIIDRHLRQEVFYREALRMGLDKDDDIIRTRLAQKMEAVSSDLSLLMQPPTEEQLRAFHAARPDLFTLPQAYAFRQVLYLPAEAGDEVLETTLASLQGGGEVPPGQRGKLAVPTDWALTPAQALENSFGGGFAESLSELPVGTWSGPVRSGLGLHLVLVTQNQPEHLAPFEEVRDFVARQYEYYTVLDAQEQMFRELLNRYEVRFEAEGVPEAVRQEYARP
ncbi:peptidyl-prolyl cis-trans isomerase [Salipiger sp. PrR003]|uniref:peptidylprolyl isomerase n=1 Tax=Salipiger sp. PrR003 TaxID=2706776 RepID=UPI0013DD39D5|nr:peptidylprolyl isomerase [Salipiger sp. PrR003]NDV51995.1 peptidyl-prolyl cis-trans isomerase [Salipiger sp. PrR003]